MKPVNAIKVKDTMTANPVMVNPAQTVKEAARIMKENDCGVLPVGTPDAVIGVITDRDITIRVTAEGADASKVPVQSVMTHKFIVCNESDDIEHAAQLMRKHDVSRLMVSKFDKVTGIVTIADLMRNTGNRHESNKVLHHLLGRKKPQKKTITNMSTAGAGCESRDA
jgi:CBS domain-containing protein